MERRRHSAASFFARKGLHTGQRRAILCIGAVIPRSETYMNDEGADSMKQSFHMENRRVLYSAMQPSSMLLLFSGTEVR